jgi:hypothetical protein
MPPGAVGRFCHRNSHSEVRAPERQRRRWWQHPPPALVMNIPANAGVVKGWILRARAGHLSRGGSVTCLLSWPIRSVHVVKMASSPAPERLIRLFPGRQSWPRHVLASSLAVHALGIALVGWATHGQLGPTVATSSQRVTRAYAVRYLVLDRPPASPGPRPEHRPPNPPAAVAPKRPSPPLPRGYVASEGERAAQNTPQPGPPAAPQTAQPSGPHPPAFASEALAPGMTVGIGVAGTLGFREPTAPAQPAKHRLDRLPELVGAASSACPELGPPARGERRSAVAVAFVVDTNGRVDRATIQVIESPGRPRTDHGFHARVYVVGASLRVAPGRSPPAADDSTLTQEVASHVAGLVFRPALKEDHAIRSTVLVSCQTY